MENYDCGQIDKMANVEGARAGQVAYDLVMYATGNETHANNEYDNAYDEAYETAINNFYR